MKLDERKRRKKERSLGFIATVRALTITHHAGGGEGQIRDCDTTIRLLLWLERQG